MPQRRYLRTNAPVDRLNEQERMVWMAYNGYYTPSKR